MTDTLFADVSEFQRPVDDSYPHQLISIRSNDGTYRDNNFAQNYAWCKSRADNGKLVGFIVYLVWESDVQGTLDTFWSMVGIAHPKMAVMIDVETWGGRYTGDCSASLNWLREQLIAGLGGNRRRVIGYGNIGDLQTMWPNRGDTQLVVADYSSNPSFPNKIAHQFSSTYPIAPFGSCDANSADGLDPYQFAAAVGIAAAPPVGVDDMFSDADRATLNQANATAWEGVRLGQVMLRTRPPCKGEVLPPLPADAVEPSWVSGLNAGEGLRPGQELFSPDGRQQLTFQGDGNVVLYGGPFGLPLWSTGTYNTPSDLLVLQADGNLVEYAGSKAVWASGTAGKGATMLVLQDDGNLVLYDAARNAVWNSGTEGK